MDLDYTGAPTSNSDGTTTFVITGTSNLLVNGDFESFTDTNGTLEANEALHVWKNIDGFNTYIGDASGWTTDDASDVSANQAVGSFVYDLGNATASPTHAALFGDGPLSDSTISQVVQTEAGAHYALDFFLREEASFEGDFFEVLWDGAVVDPARFHQETVGGGSHFWVDLMATGSTSTLGLHAGHAAGFWYLDDVALTPELANGTLLVGAPEGTLSVADDNAATNIGHFTSEVTSQEAGTIVWHYSLDQTHVTGITFQVYPLELIHDTNVVTISDGSSNETEVTIGVMTGTRLSDTFEFNRSMDIETITNFSHQEGFLDDKIDLQDFNETVESFDDLIDHIQSANNDRDTIITLGETSIHLMNVSASTLQAADFVI